MANTNTALREDELDQSNKTLTQDPLKVMVVAGEASSDQHAASVVSELLKLRPGTEVFGMGGRELRNAGMETIVDAEKDASVMGFVEVVGKAGSIIKSFNCLKRAAKIRKPDVAILVDYAEFNLRLARKLKKQGIPVYYFISPQIWAWRSGRVKTIKKFVDHVSTIFPFEVDFYRDHGVSADFVGHPFLDRAPKTTGREKFLSPLGMNPRHPFIGLLPGSRQSEVKLLLPSMVGAFERLASRYKNLDAILPLAPAVDAEWVKEITKGNQRIHLIQGDASCVLQLASASIVTSGTATIEAALAGNPFVVVYRTSPLSYAIGKKLVKGIDHFAMVNLVAGEKIVPELLQDEVQEERLAFEIQSFLDNTARRQQTMRKLRGVRERLNCLSTEGSTSAERAAKRAISLAKTV